VVGIRKPTISDKNALVAHKIGQVQILSATIIQNCPSFCQHLLPKVKKNKSLEKNKH